MRIVGVAGVESLTQHKFQRHSELCRVGIMASVASVCCARPWMQLSRLQVRRELRRGLVSNSEGNGPPRVLITGGLGQLGSGLAKVLRWMFVLPRRLFV